MLPTAPPAPSLPGHPAETNSVLTCAYEIVGVGASLGGLAALTELLSPLPADFPMPILVVQHLPANSLNLLPKLLAGRTHLLPKLAEAGERPKPGTVNVAP